MKFEKGKKYKRLATNGTPSKLITVGKIYECIESCNNKFISLDDNGKIWRTYWHHAYELVEESTKYEGEIKGFPKEVVDKMCAKQMMQGNPKDISVFENYKERGKAKGGFDWHITCEGNQWWEEVIANQNFKTFFERYPASETKTTTFPEKWVVKGEFTLSGSDKDRPSVNKDHWIHGVMNDTNSLGFYYNYYYDKNSNFSTAVPKSHTIVTKQQLLEHFGIIKTPSPDKSPEKIKSVFNRGDFVVVTNVPSKDWWIKEGEIVELGGYYWLEDDYRFRSRIDSQECIAAITNEEPNGNGAHTLSTSNSKLSANFRHATGYEKELVNQFGRGTCIDKDVIVDQSVGISDIITKPSYHNWDPSFDTTTLPIYEKREFQPINGSLGAKREKKSIELPLIPTISRR